MGTTVRESVLLIAVFTSRCLASSDMARLVCQFRESALPTEVFPLHAGYRCLSYNDRRVFVGDEIPAAAACSIEGLGLDGIYPCYQRGNGSLAFDPSDEEAYRALAARFKKGSDAARWRRCYEAARRCCARIVTPRGAERDPSRCPALWDGWDCWDSAPEDSYEDSYCKEYIYSADAAPSCHYPSRKRCLARTVANSTRAEWDQTTDYTGCTTKSRLVTKYSFHAAMLGVSIALSLPAVVVFFCYRRLRIPRIALHRNLLIVIVVRSALTILQIVALSFDSLEATDEASVMDQNGAGCRLLSALVQLFSNAVFATMLAEGVFLHRLIAAVFKSQPNMVWLYSLAAAIAVLPMVPWTILRIVKYDYSCWATGAADLDWINNGTRVALLAINFILMLDIIRVLLTKLRGVNSWHSDKIKRTARSTLFLLPLFGVNTLVVADKPSVIPSCDWESVFDMVGHTMEGLQGPCVALLYCYMNKESVFDMVGHTMEGLQGPCVALLYCYMNKEVSCCKHIA
ncbi:calcitonin gene-related peptide type 1 receptor-like [Bacillus rossius redtenbacheri]|uniref:calcitonin gene-related peptide type 1 receptor-like n=1 Tax=Bacillus rossius redtenbacheri TaxID=93214 RepID=UPI002FDD3CF2